MIKRLHLIGPGWLFPNLLAERQVIIHGLAELTLQLRRLFCLKIYKIPDTENPPIINSVISGILRLRRISPIGKHHIFLHAVIGHPALDG